MNEKEIKKEFKERQSKWGNRKLKEWNGKRKGKGEMEWMQKIII